jgi:hypothetical protein
MPSTILSDNGVTSNTSGIKVAGSNDGILELQTTTAGGTATAAITIDTAQRSKFPTTIGVGGATPSTSGSGISFPATASASSDANTLDDYEEGTWTPRLQGTSGANTGQTGTFSGTYTKIGRFVIASFSITLTAKGTFSGVGVLIGNMPFAPANSNYHSPVFFADLAINWIHVMTQTRIGLTTAYLLGNKAAAASTTYLADGGGDIGNSTAILGCFYYEV